MSFRVFALASACAVSSLAFAREARTVPNRILVKFRSDVAGLHSHASSLNRSFAARELGRLSEISVVSGNLAVLRFSTSLKAIDAARQLARHPNVEWAQPDYILTLVDGETPSVESPLPNVIPDPVLNPAPAVGPSVVDPDLAKAWGLATIRAAEAWAMQPGSRDVIVADIDTGVDYNHEDLAANMWRNPNPTMGDLVGYDFAHNDPMPFDDHGHGTHTSGSIGAVGNNGIGIAGVAPNVSIMALKFIKKEGEGTTSDAIKAIDYAVANGARILSNSWGGPADDAAENLALEEAVERANVAGVLFVAAAGNDGSDNDAKPMYPAAIRKPNVLTVASTNDRDRRSFFSNYGRETVHVAAPGSNVYSSTPGNKYELQSGTSMACPHVAGLAALLLAERPSLTPVELKQIIMDSADKLPALDGLVASGARINAVNAVRMARDLGAR